MTDLPAGIYKHYKGGLYMLLGTSEHSETHEKLIAYIQLSGAQGSKMWVRPYNMFREEVIVNGIKKPRFVYIGQEIPEIIAKFYDPLSGYIGGDRVDG